jgi:hypothetical protein
MPTALPVRVCRYAKILDGIYDSGTQKYAPEHPRYQ